MATDKPRIQVTLDLKTNALLSVLAEQQELPVASLAGELIRQALELHEDRALSKLADERLATNKKWHSHAQAWK